MNDIILSVIIPSYKDPLLHKTVDSLIENSGLGNKLEIVVCLDGYWTEVREGVKVVHLGKNRGMRGAINAGVAVSKGEYIMRTDEHCMFCKGYDKILTESCKDNWIMTMRRYFLDPVKWKVMDLPFIDYEKLVIQGGKKFAGQNWKSRNIKRKDIMIDETMAMQGSMWCMSRKHWDNIGELDSKNYGPLYQDSHEMIFKTWKIGGKMMLNKNAWFAHKHRKFPRTHNSGTKENPSNNDLCFKYSLDTWRDYYENVIRPRWGI